MKPNIKWVDDWRIGMKPSREKEVSIDLINFFIDFWVKEKMGKKSKTTMNRYSNALHAIGGYLVEQAISDENLDKTTCKLLSLYISLDEGPFIHHENIEWQDEVDRVCRKIFKHMKKNELTMR